MPSQAVLELLIQMKDEASAGLGKLGDVLGTVGSVAGGVALAGVTAFGAAVVSGIGDAKEAAQVYAQTEAVIKSTGGAAGVSADQVADYAASLSAAAGKSLFGDDQIQQGENLLLTFTNIKETLPDATKIMVDMAQAMGTDVKGGAIQLGKALNDPIAGISALSRVGVTFDEQQKKVIKRLQESGDTAGAQRIILAELNKEFGGSAQAAADASGGMAQFQDRLGEAKETLGTAVLPLLNGLVGLLNANVLPAVEAGAQAFADLVGAFQTGASEGGGFIGGLTNALYSLDSISPVFDTVGDAINDIAATLADTGPLSSEFGETLGGIATQFGLTAAQADVFEHVIFAVQGGIQQLVATFTDAANPVEGFLNVMSSISPMFALVRGVIEGVMPAIQVTITEALGVIAAFWEANGADILATVQEVWGQIQGIINTALPLIQGIIMGVLAVIVGFIREHGEQIQQVLTAAWTIIKNVITGALAIIQGVLSAALAIFRGDWQGAWQAIQQMSVTVVQKLGEIIKAGLDIIAAFFGTSIDKIIALWTNLGSQALSLGRNIINGIIQGLENAAGALYDTITGIVGKMFSHAEDAGDIHSPSKLFAKGIGLPIVQGVIVGIQGGIPALLSVIDQMGIAMIDALKKKTDKAVAQVDKFIADLVKQAGQIGSQINDAIAGGFKGEASIDRLLADNLDAIKDFTGKLGADVRAQLDQALSAAGQIGDPTQAAAFYKMRSDQILELADLQDQLNQDLSKDDRARITQQLDLIKAAQAAEQSAFGAENAGKQSPIATLAAQLQALLVQLPSITESPIVASLTTMLQQLRDASGSFSAPGLTLAGAQPLGTDRVGSTTYNVTIAVPPGTTSQQAGDIARQLGNLAKNRRAS